MSRIDHHRWGVEAHNNWQMRKRETEKRFHTAVAQIASEMAQPRQPASVRKQLEKGNENIPNKSDLIVKNNVQKRTVDCQTAVVVHKT